ncbi:MAG: hypothetical protein ACLRXQ_01330 [Phascolarctobacterium faecium]
MVDPSDADSPMLQNNGTDIVNNLKQDRRQFMQYQGVGRCRKTAAPLL